MRAGWIGWGVLALVAGCQDRNPGDDQAATGNTSMPRTIENLAMPPAELDDDAAPDVDLDADTPVRAEMPVPGTIPFAFQGRWAADRSKCGDGQEQGLTVTPRMLRFYESEGKVAAVKVTGARAITVTSRFSGEGQSWQDSQRLSLSEDGRTLVIAGKGSATRRVKCS